MQNTSLFTGFNKRKRELANFYPFLLLVEILSHINLARKFFLENDQENA
jgi:hypothetical protein